MNQSELTSSIIAASFEVINELGAGFLESVYENALRVALAQKGIDARNQVALPVHFKGVLVGNYFADLIVNNEVVVELKAVKKLSPEHLAQTINYLRATGLKVALLINFGNPKLEFKRLSNNLPEDRYPVYPVHPCE